MYTISCRVPAGLSSWPHAQVQEKEKLPAEKRSLAVAVAPAWNRLTNCLEQVFDIGDIGLHIIEISLIRAFFPVRSSRRPFIFYVRLIRP